MTKRSALTLAAGVLLSIVATEVPSAGQAQNQPPTAALSRADEMLKMWNDIGNKLIAMAQDFPEDKYDFKVQKDERTFALNLLPCGRAGLCPDTENFRIQSRA